MGADVPQAVDPARLGGVAPPGPLLAAAVVLAVQPALGVLGHHGADRPDLSGPDQVPDVLGGDMAGVGVGDHEEKPLLLGQLLQLLPLGAVGGQGLVAGHVDARLQKGLADLIVGDVGGDHHHKVDAVLPLCLGPGHLPVVGVAPLRVQAQLLPQGAGLLRTPGEAPGRQPGRAVQGDGLPVGLPDKRTGAASHHTIGQCSAHAVSLLFWDACRRRCSSASHRGILLLL